MNAKDISKDFGFVPDGKNMVGNQVEAEQMVRALLTTRRNAIINEEEWDRLKAKYPPARILNDAGFGTMPGEQSNVVIGSDWEFDFLERIIATYYTNGG